MIGAVISKVEETEYRCFIFLILCHLPYVVVVVSHCLFIIMSVEGSVGMKRCNKHVYAFGPFC